MKILTDVVILLLSSFLFVGCDYFADEKEGVLLAPEEGVTYNLATGEEIPDRTNFDDGSIVPNNSDKNSEHYSAYEDRYVDYTLDRGYSDADKEQIMKWESVSPCLIDFEKVFGVETLTEFFDRDIAKFYKSNKVLDYDFVDCTYEYEKDDAKYSVTYVEVDYAKKTFGDAKESSLFGACDILSEGDPILEVACSNSVYLVVVEEGVLYRVSVGVNFYNKDDISFDELLEIAHAVYDEIHGNEGR